MRVDYDQIAAEYNQRYQVNPLAGVEERLIQIGRQLNARCILEAGCGTGRWLASSRSAFPEAQILGLDASMGMLSRVSSQPQPLLLVQGKAGHLPFKGRTFDFIFCVNALHHFEDPAGFIQGAQKLLRPGGKLAIVGQIPSDRHNRWYVYDYFEGIYEKDLQRFPRWGTVTNWMVEAGYQQISWEPVERISDDKIGWAVLQDPFLQKQVTSQLALLSDRAYTAGLEKIKADLTKAGQHSETLVFHTQLRLDMMIATAP